MNTTQLLLVFAAIGVADTLYLIYHKIRGTDVACPLFPREWCYKVQHAPQSATFGIPNSVAGFFMYVLILSLVICQGPVEALKIIIAVGFAFSLYFTYVQGFVLRAFCTWCVISFINFSAMFWLVFFR